MGYELCLVSTLVRTDDEAACLAAELAAQHDLDCSVSATEAKMEITAKAKLVITAEGIRVNTKTTVVSEECSGVEIGGTSAAESIFSDNSNSTQPRSTSSNP